MKGCIGDKALTGIQEKNTAVVIERKLALVNKRSFKAFGSWNITDCMKKYLFIFTDFKPI